MDPTLLNQLIILVFLLFLSAFFSASETTFTSCSQSKFFRLARTRRVKRLISLFNQKENLISFILLGNNTVNIFASSLATVFSLHYLENNPFLQPYALEISATVMTFTILIFSEIVPKTIAIRNPERIVFLLVDVYFVLLKVFKPFIMLVNGITRIALKVVGVHESKQYEAMTARDSIRSEIEFYHSQGSVIQKDKEMLGGVLDLMETKLSSVITHRKDVEMIDLTNSSFEEIEEMCIESSYTRIPVYNEDPDKILGILHFRDFFTLKSYNATPTIEDVKNILIKPQYASSETTLLSQLTEFKKSKNHLAIVVDEYGSMIGIITLEDIVEEIVGDIEDEHDDESDDENEIIIQEDGSFIVEGGVLIRDLTRKTDISIENVENVSTIAGFVIYHLHKIPKKGEKTTINGVIFEVLEADAHKIKSIKITIIADFDPED